MAIPKLTPYTGQVANPDGSQTQTEFTTNMFNQLSYEANLAVELDATIDGVNNAVDEVNASASSAESSANAAEAAASSAGYKGLWPDTGGSAEKGDTYQTQVGGTPTGEYYTALQNTSIDPVGDNVNWKVDVSGGYVNKAQEEVIDGKIFPVDRTVKNGDIVPAEATHLRALVDGRPTVVAMQPIASGVVSSISDDGANIGGIDVSFYSSQIKYFNSIEEMLSSNTIIGGNYVTNNCNLWTKKSNSSGDISDFESHDVVNIASLGAKFDGSDETSVLQEAINLGKSVYLGDAGQRMVINGLIGLPKIDIRDLKKIFIFGRGVELEINSREACFTSAETVSDPDIEADLFTANYTWDGIAFTSTNNGVVFNGDRLYNCTAENCTFRAVGCTLKSFRKKDDTGFHDDGYIQSFSLLNNLFSFCVKILEANKAYNFNFIGNRGETNQNGLMFFGDSSSSKVTIDNNLFQNGGLFLSLNAAKSRGLSIQGNYLEFNSSNEAAARNCQIDLSGSPYSSERGLDAPLTLSGNHFLLTGAQTSDASYSCVKVTEGEEYLDLCSVAAQNWTNHKNQNIFNATAMCSYANGVNLLANSGFDSVSIPDYTLTTNRYVADAWQTDSLAKTVITGFDDKGSSIRLQYSDTSSDGYVLQDIPSKVLGWNDLVAGKFITTSFNLNLNQDTDVFVRVSVREVGSQVDLAFNDSQTLSFQSGLRYGSLTVNIPDFSGVGTTEYKVTVTIWFKVQGLTDPVVKIYRAKSELGKIATAYSDGQPVERIYRAGNYDTDIDYRDVSPRLSHSAVIQVGQGMAGVIFDDPKCTNVRIYETSGAITNVNPNDVTLENINNNSAIRITYARGSNYSGIAGIDNLVSRLKL